MTSLFRRLLLSAIALAAPLAFAADSGIEVFTGPEADEEAARLYERADNYVTNVVEGQYSYAYIQFHWKRAASNIDRIRSAYPDSPTAKRLAAGELRVGSFETAYFKERVLPRLEEKKVGAFDAVNCAIFLYNLEGNQDAAARKLLLEEIIETLCRQIRWNEALDFPVLDQDRPWLWNIVVRQAATYRNDPLVVELVKNVLPVEARPMLLASVAEGLAFRGEDREALEKFLEDNGNSADLRLAALRGLVRREIQIERAVQLRQPLKGLYDGVDGVQFPEKRSDVRAFAATLPGSHQAAANRLLGWFAAATGQAEEARRLGWSDEAAAGFIEHLILHERLDEARAQTARGNDAVKADALVAFARAGLTEQSAALRDELAARIGADEAAFLEFRGHMLSSANQLVVREHTFAKLPVSDPNLVGRLICEWSLTPNRTLRGAAPWDAVVGKFAPGFENLREPEDKRKIEASAR